MELPTDEADTIGGFVFGLLGHQAQAGERARFGELEFAVEATDGRRITRVRLTHRPLAEKDSASGPSASRENSAITANAA